MPIEWPSSIFLIAKIHDVFECHLSSIGRSIFLPNGTALRAAYAGMAVEGEIVGGMWVVAGHAYNSPSAALNANVRTRDGNTVNLNGWRHWEVRVPGSDTWVRLHRFEPE